MMNRWFTGLWKTIPEGWRRRFPALFLILAALIVYAAFGTGSSSGDEVCFEAKNAELHQEEIEDEVKAISAVKEPEGETKTVQQIYVDVSGKVRAPAVITLDEGSRVYQAIDAAGGITEDAAVEYLNLAEVIYDGQKIYVPGKTEMTQDPGAAFSTPQSGAAESSASQAKVNINTAGSEQLQQLKGVGPATARRIIEYRNENGRFSQVEDLSKVKGIGTKTLEKLKNSICV